MKIFVTILFSFLFIASFGQPISPRSNGMVTVVDSNLFAGNSFRVPIFADTNHANINRPSLDSAGKVIFTYNTNWFWGRQTSPTRKWVPFNNSSSTGLNASCGSPNGTHLVTYDSSTTRGATFDVSGGPYVICCDGIPRATNNTSVTLDSNSTSFQRLDLIILDTNGVNWVKGTPALNPSTPNTDSCQIILSYVLMNANSSVPANISPTNPFIIYDENYNTEWHKDSSRNVVLDTANTVFPVHLTHAINVSSFTPDNNEFFLTGSSTINLNDYTIFKFYIKRAVAAGTLSVTFSWYLNGVQQTLPVTLLPPLSTAYQTYAFATSAFQIIGGTTVNQLKVSFGGSTQSVYLDWIQLQNGATITNIGSSGTVTSVGMNDLDSLLHPTVTNPTVNPVFSFTKYTVPANSVLINNSNIPAQYTWGKIDLSSNLFVNTFPVTDLAPGPVGTYLGTNAGPVVQWTQFTNDTTFIRNWLIRRPDPLSGNDTLQFGSPSLDSSLLTFDTYVGLNGHFFDMEYNGNDWFLVNAKSGQESISFLSTDGAGTSGLTLNSNISNYNWVIGANDGVNSVNISGNFSPGEIQVNSDHTLFNSRVQFHETTASSANNLVLPSGANVFQISGSTQINLINETNWTEGSVIYLLFETNVTVKNNQVTSLPNVKILLAGGGDFSATSDDILTLVLSGTTPLTLAWREVSRSVN